MIWATESRIVKGHREPIQVVVTNVLAMSSLMILLTMYMSSSGCGWWSDLLIGFMGGVGLGAIQSLAIKSPVSLAIVWHSPCLLHWVGRDTSAGSHCIGGCQYSGRHHCCDSRHPLS